MRTVPAVEHCAHISVWKPQKLGYNILKQTESTNQIKKIIKNSNYFKKNYFKSLLVEGAKNLIKCQQ